MTNLIIPDTKLARAVEHGVDMHRRRRGLARQHAQLVHKLLLQLTRQVILRAEEDDTALRNCSSKLLLLVVSQ